MVSIEEKFSDQVEYFQKMTSEDLSRRTSLLIKLYKIIEKNEGLIINALKVDLRKSEFESVIGETQFILNEIKNALRNIKKWTKVRRVGSPFVHFPVKSTIKPMPLGVVLIIGPWNYPFQLLMSPLIGAISAGNTAIIKPSEVSKETSQVVAKLINDNFNPKEIFVVEGGVEETNELLECRFNHIFYTGSSRVGRIIMEKAAKHLCPVTLELGGKSPCLIYDVKNVEATCRRIVWGKFFNAGQTCVAPDYILTNKEIYPKLILGIKKVIKEFYGEDVQASTDYGRIINEKNFDRLMNYFKDVEVIVGGESDREDLYISPSVVKASWDDEIMKEEIFGPLLPIVVVKDFLRAKSLVQNGERPLAAYLFSDNSDYKKIFSDEVISGGMCINDTIIHLTNGELPFGGVGESGIGSYHGEHSFKSFSHFKSIMSRPLWGDLTLRYPPYVGKLNFLRKILKFLG